jgi:hypothetical protein
MAKRRQAVRPTTRKLPTKSKRAPADVDLKKENATLRLELAEAIERQNATSEVLQVISSKPGELAPVFQSMLENATRVCGAKFGIMNLYEGAESPGRRRRGAPDQAHRFCRASHRDRQPRGKGGVIVGRRTSELMSALRPKTNVAASNSDVRCTLNGGNSALQSAKS